MTKFRDFSLLEAVERFVRSFNLNQFEFVGHDVGTPPRLDGLTKMGSLREGTCPLNLLQATFSCVPTKQEILRNLRLFGDVI